MSRANARRPARRRAAGLACSRHERRAFLSLRQASGGHFEPCDLSFGPVPVLPTGQDAEAGSRVALERDDGIDRVLERTGAGKVSLLGHVAHEKDGDSLLLRQSDQRVRAPANLADSPRDGVRVRVADGLHRIHDQNPGRLLGRRGEDAGQLAAGHVPKRASVQTEPVGTRCHLPTTLFPGGEKAGVPGFGQARRQLEEKGRLAGAGRPCHENHRSWDKPAAEDAIDAGRSCRESVLLGIRGKRRHRGGGRADGSPRPGGMLADRAPISTARAPARPLG